MADTMPSDENKLFSGILRLNTRMLGLVLGIMLGLFIFLATNWIVIRGGHTTSGGEYIVGPHIQLLSQFFIGYRVSFLGSIIGFAYGFAVGTLSGSLIGWIYNRIVGYRK
jgi:hypothetical protein